MSTPIYVIGSSNTDMVVKAEKLPSPGETVLGGKFLMNPGGKGANQAVSAARLGSEVTFIAKVGNDLFGKQAVQQFKAERIHTQFISSDPELASGVALIGVDQKGQNSIIVAPGANKKMDPRIVEQALSQLDTDVLVLMQLEISLQVVEFTIAFCTARGIRVILNPAPVQLLDEKLFKGLFAITPNEFEAEMLTGIKVTDGQTAELAAKQLYDLGVQNVVITLGDKGAYLYNSSESVLVPAPFVTAMDTTAAGDCFNGALTVGISEGMPLKDAVEFAVKAASISVTRMGAQSSLPYRKEVDEIALVSSLRHP